MLFLLIFFLCVSKMDPVQKAVINHTFGVPQPLKKKQIISCNICHLRFNSTVRNASVASCCGAYGEDREETREKKRCYAKLDTLQH